MKKTIVAALFAAAFAGCNGDVDTSDTTADADTDADTDSDTDTDTQTCETDICAVYGAAVPQVASDIVDAAAADPEFSDDFAGLVARGDTAVAEFKTSLANFISDAYGCSTGAYTGPTMQQAHSGMAITQDEYDDFIALIAGVLIEDGVTEDDVNYCFAPPLVDTAFSSTIVGQ